MPEGKKMKVYTVAQVNAYVKGMLDAEPFYSVLWCVARFPTTAEMVRLDMLTSP